MTYYRRIIVLLLLMQVLVSCWARSPFVPSTWSAPAVDWNETDDVDASNKNSAVDAMNENDLLDRFLPVDYKAKKALRDNVRFGTDGRRKKFLSESTNLQGGHSLQGLWAMPGRR